MLPLVLVTVFLHLISNGQSIEGKPEEKVLALASEPTGQNPSTEGPMAPPLPSRPHKYGVTVPQDFVIGAVRKDIGDHWPLGVIPYYFDTESYDQLIAIRFRAVLNSVEFSSCLKFKSLSEKPTDGNITWLHVTNPDRERACVHEPAVNFTSGEIQVLLGLDCLKRRDVLHTLLHTIGLKDEVGHPQRDQYIRVLWENIQHEYRKLFRVQLYGDILTEYDPASIMHFHDRAFTLNGQATIAPLMSGLFINPSNNLSPLDKMKLRILFSRECNRRKVGNLLDTCKNVLHKQYHEGDRDEKFEDFTVLNDKNRPADKQDPANVACAPGQLGGCMPIDDTREREKIDQDYIANKERDKVEQENNVDQETPAAELNADDNKPSAEVVEIID